MDTGRLGLSRRPGFGRVVVGNVAGFDLRKVPRAVVGRTSVGFGCDKRPARQAERDRLVVGVVKATGPGRQEVKQSPGRQEEKQSPGRLVVKLAPGRQTCACGSPRP